jgi:hypothetical protein
MRTQSELEYMRVDNYSVEDTVVGIDLNGIIDIAQRVISGLD